MKLLHICSDYIYTKLYYELISRLETNEIQNTVYVPAILNANYENRKENASFNVIVSNVYKKIDRYFFKLKEKKIYNDIIKKIDIKNFDKVHAHTLFTAGYIAYKIKKEYNIGYVVSVRSTDITFFKKRKNLKRIGINTLLESDKIVCISKTHKQVLIDKIIPKKYKEIIENKITVIHNGINKIWLDNINSEKDEPKECINLVQTGLMIKRKHLESSIIATKQLNDEGVNACLYAIGDGPLLEEYKQQYKLPYVFFTGRLDKEKIIDLYKKMHIFILPSTGETFGLVYAEAMSQGLPVLYSANEGFDNIFDDGVVGYRINYNNIQDIVNKIKLIKNDYLKFSKNASKNAKIFNWDDITLQFKMLY